MNVSAANLFAWLVFGLIGMGAFMYGKKQGNWKVMIIAAGLMVYPYFVANTILLYVLGVLLTVALFVVRD